MSAERFEITLSDDGLIHISGSNGRRASLITPDGIIGYVTHGAIRQQARDIKLLTQMLHDQRLVIDDLEHRRVKVCDENDQLRADLAAAVAERDRLLAELADSYTKLASVDIARDVAEARLAAIDAAPTVGWLRPYGRGLSTSEPSGERMPQYELIARPAKD